MRLLDTVSIAQCLPALGASPGPLLLPSQQKHPPVVSPDPFDESFEVAFLRHKISLPHSTIELLLGPSCNMRLLSVKVRVHFRPYRFQVPYTKRVDPISQVPTALESHQGKCMSRPPNSPHGH